MRGLTLRMLERAFMVTICSGTRIGRIMISCKVTRACILETKEKEGVEHSQDVWRFQ